MLLYCARVDLIAALIFLLPNLRRQRSNYQIIFKRCHVDETVNPLDVARMTVFKAGADLANIANEAGLIAIRDGRTKINQADLIQAIQRVSFGMSYSGNILRDELLHTAYHEAGHAIVCYFRNRKDHIQVLTIVPSWPRSGLSLASAKRRLSHRIQRRIYGTAWKCL